MFSRENAAGGGEEASIYFNPNDDRYYAWKTMFPGGEEGGTFPNPPEEKTIPGLSPNVWHVLFQFHHLGNCGSPPVSMNLERLGGAGGANEYEWVLAGWRGTDPKAPFPGPGSLYPDVMAQPLWREKTGIVRDVWYEFVLRVYWSTVPCSSCDPAQPDGGLVELWFRDAAQNTTYVGLFPLATLYEFSGQCSPHDDYLLQSPYPYSAGDPQPAYLKIGNYRDPNLVDGNDPYVETLYHGDVWTGMTCDSVWNYNSGLSPCPR